MNSLLNFFYKMNPLNLLTGSYRNGPLFWFNDFLGGGEIHEAFALSNYDIEKIMREFDPVNRYFKGTYCIDEFFKLPRYGLQHCDKWAVIILSIKSNEPSNKIGHWTSLVVDNNKRQFLYYDSFGDPPPYSNEFNQTLLKLKKYPNEYYQVKINRIKNQRIDSVRCGYFSILFILDIFKYHKTFKQATNFNTITGEQRAKLLEKKFRHI